MVNNSVNNLASTSRAAGTGSAKNTGDSAGDSASYQPNYTVLICDDDPDILAALEIYLKQEGYRVLQAQNGTEAVRTVEKESIHLIVLDVMMPKMDGITAAVKIRETSNAPILFLSAKSEDTDRVLGLNMGGDDYITKPFNPVELLARIKAALRRYARLGGLQTEQAEQAGSGNKSTKTSTAGAQTAGQAAAQTGAQAAGQTTSQATAPTNLYETGGLILDDRQKRVTIDGDEVLLTALEYNILKLLMGNMDCVYTSAQIYEAVWDEPALQVPKTVSVHIRHIREKIEINPKEPRYLKVIYGLGYKVVKLK
ncbi:MAG: response regulator transcription factor [Coriobacteriales bacterium]|jgi:DNA-binding response OmpR family regulator|nr:response regulator transcription factor [Coriobacteriales bacterium]